MKRNLLTILSILSVVLIMVDCRKEKDFGLEPESSILTGIRIPSSQVPLFAEFSNYNLGTPLPETRSEETVLLEDLLDMNEIKSKEVNGVEYIQIPFKQNAEGIMAVLHKDRNHYDEDDMVRVKKYYIETSSKVGRMHFVVTMIPKKQYDKFNDYDFLTKPYYSGLVLFSTPEGKLIYTKKYSEGRIMKYITLDVEQLKNYNEEELSYFSLFIPGAETRGLLDFLGKLLGAGWGPDDYYGGDINPSTCTGTSQPPYSGWDGYGSTGNHSGGGGTGLQLEYYVLPDMDIDDPWVPLDPSYMVSVSSNLPDFIRMIGSGIYVAGQMANIDYEMKYQVLKDIPFGYWVGDLGQYDSPRLRIRIENDILSQAYFNLNQLPCLDKEGNLANPLHSMRIAPSKKVFINGKLSYSYIGGTFGYVRNEGTRLHQGIDFLAALGTEVFSMYDGKIVRIVSNAPAGVTNTPSKAFGNQIYIECKVNNPKTGAPETIYIQYAHLQYGNPVAINPATGEPFIVGDFVKAGQLIGYTGRTGNAWNIAEYRYHLHLGVRTALWGDFIDPRPYINGSFGNTNEELLRTDGHVQSKRCDGGTEVDIKDIIDPADPHYEDIIRLYRNMEGGVFPDGEDSNDDDHPGDEDMEEADEEDEAGV